MTYSLPSTKITGDSAPASDWNTFVRANFMHFADDHDHGSADHGSTALGATGGIVSIKFTDASAPSAPGAGKTLLYSVSGKMHQRAGASGDDEEFGISDHSHTIASDSASSDWTDTGIGGQTTTYVTVTNATNNFTPDGPRHASTFMLRGMFHNYNGNANANSQARALWGGVEKCSVSYALPTFLQEAHFLTDAVVIEPSSVSTEMTVQHKTSGAGAGDPMTTDNLGWRIREIQCQ